jgi:hypothetical protein
MHDDCLIIICIRALACPILLGPFLLCVLSTTLCARSLLNGAFFPVACHLEYLFNHTC